MRRAVDGQDLGGIEYTAQRKDGTQFPVVIYSSPIVRGQAPAGLRGIIVDVTERKRAEEDYRTLFREMLNGFALHEIICDEAGNPADYRFLAVNPAFERITGLKREDIVGRTVLEAMPTTERHWIKTYGKVALTGKPAFFEKYHAMLNRHFEVAAFQPAPNQFACIFADVTERKRAEIALRESEDRLRLAAQAANFGTYDYNFLTNVAHWTPEFKALFGLAPDAPCQTDENLVPIGVHPDDRSATVEAFKASLDPRGPGSLNVEHRVIHPDGSVHWVSAQGRVFFSGEDEARRPVRAAGTLVDVTGRKRAEEALQESEKRQAEAEKLAAVGRMAARVAHEINNPLAGIRNAFRLVRDAVPEDHPDHDMVERIEREIDRIANIVRQMYTLYSPQRGENRRRRGRRRHPRRAADARTAAPGIRGTI